MSSKGGARGFTLLEMLIALAILGLSLAGIYAVVSGSLSRLENAMARREAAAIAAAILTEAANAHPIVSGTTSGEAADGARWQLDVTQEGPQAAGEIRVIRLEVTVQRSGTSVTRTVWRAASVQ